MLYTKTAPVGVDVPVQNLQSFLYTQLKNKWKIDNDVDYDAYGRVYREQTTEGYIPRMFVSSTQSDNTLYKDVFFDDSLNSAVSFFDTGSALTYDNRTATIKAWMIFMVNLAKLKKTIEHRADEEVRRDVALLCQNSRWGFRLTEIDTGYKKVFSEYDGLLKGEQPVLRDMHPLHCFRLGFTLIYDINEC